MSAWPARVQIVEVGPRDGLQNEPAKVPAPVKIAFVDRLVAAGHSIIEAGAFVSPKWVPQMADTADVFAGMTRRPNVRYVALVPNATGLRRALDAHADTIAIFAAASQTFSRRNVNQTIAESLAGYRTVCEEALAAGVAVRAYLSTSFGCPFEGAVPVETVCDLTARLVDMGAYQVAISDTIGVGNPRQTREIVRAHLDAIPSEAIALHLHDTRGTALANVLVGLELGIRTIDASVGGLGGCPYAPGAAGNLATEDLVFMLEGMGLATGVDLARLIDAARLAESVVGRPLPGKVHQAGLFRPRGAART